MTQSEFINTYLFVTAARNKCIEKIMTYLLLVGTYTHSDHLYSTKQTHVLKKKQTAQCNYCEQIL